MSTKYITIVIKYSITDLRASTSLALYHKNPEEKPRQQMSLVIVNTKITKLHVSELQIKEGYWEEMREVQQREQHVQVYGNQSVPPYSPGCRDGHLCMRANAGDLP